MTKRKLAYYSAGFTLVELIITMLLAGIISISIFSAYKAQQRSYIVQDQVTEMQQRVRAGLDLMVKEVRLAGYDPNHVYKPFSSIVNEVDAIGIFDAADDHLTFIFVAADDNDDNDGDGTDDEDNEKKYITYDIYDAYSDGTMDLGRLPNDPDGDTKVGLLDGSKRALIENIEELEFYYTLEDGTQKINPTVDEYQSIRSVQITILVRSTLPDEEFSSFDHTYTTPSGATWGPYNGPPATEYKLRRRLLTTTVQFRNLGLDLI